jgi:TonB family protein
MKFLSSNITYPDDARNQKKEGQVLVEFVVSSDGTVKSECVRIVKGVFESLDNEAKRVINLSPKWTPGTRNGQPIDMRMVMPINFKL